MPSECERAAECVETALAGQLEIMNSHAEGVRKGDMDAVHDMRVASRRVRAILRVYKPYLDKDARKTMKQGARTIGKALGRRRELDVMVAMLREHREETRDLWKRFMDHAIAILEERREREQDTCRAALDVLEDTNFQEACTRAQEQIDASAACVVAHAESALLDGLERVRSARKVWKSTEEPEDLHKIRVELKRFRYACEFHKDLFGKPMEEYIANLKSVQDVLGEWNECRVLEEMVLILGNAAPYDIAQGAPLVAEAYGERALVLEERFVPLGKKLVGKKGRKAFKKLLKKHAADCCVED